MIIDNLEDLLVIEKRIDERDVEDIRDRWESGKVLIAERVKPSGRGRPGIPKDRMAALVEAIGKSKQELSYRMQFFDQYPTEDNLSKALDKFPSWTQVIASLSKSKGKAKDDESEPSAPTTRLVDDPEIRSAVESLPGKSAAEIKGELAAKGIVNPATGKTPSVDTINDVMRSVQAERAAAPVTWESIPGNQQVKLADAKERQRKKLEREYAEKVAAETARLKAEAGKAVEDYKAQLLADAATEREARDAERKRYKTACDVFRSHGVMSEADYKAIRAALHSDKHVKCGTDMDAAFILFNDERIKTALLMGPGQ